MKKHKQTALALVIIVLVIGVVQFKRTHVPSQKISGTVTSVISRPNRAEDGYRGVEVKDGAGHTYTVDATGYLNSPLTAAANDRACVVLPSVKIGDKVVFNLPKATYAQSTFEICHKKQLNGYFFKLQ